MNKSRGKKKNYEKKFKRKRKEVERIEVKHRKEGMKECRK